MNDLPRPTARRRRPSSRRPPSPRKRIRVGRLLVWVAVLLVAGGAAYLLRDWRPGGDVLDGVDPSLTAPKDEAPAAGDRAVLLVFPEWDASGYITEQRRIPSEGHADEDLLQLLRELCAGPRISGAVAGIPPAARPLSVFLDASTGAAVVDFSLELVTEHPGGSAAEVATLTSILRTVALNFPDLESCRILVDGAPVQTLAGHHVMAEPFVLRRWL